MSPNLPVIELARQLIQQPSVTPDDAGCQALIGDRLERLGFTLTPLPFGDVDNLWAEYGDPADPLLCFAGHTDVVPSGDASLWSHPPFAAIDDGEWLYGRGAADMKGSLAAMVTAIETFLPQQPAPPIRIALLLTSDEEGPAVNGTVKVVEWLQQRGESIRWCLVGEPSSSERVGDVIKNGRRGSLGATLVFEGTQGHVAYPQHADNPVHRALPALAELASTEWDRGNDDFPPTTFQISNVKAGTGATNVIPGEFTVCCNFRFSTESTAAELQQRTGEILHRHGVRCQVHWEHSGEPFLTAGGQLLDAVRDAVNSVCDYVPQPSTSGGTSDGRFIAPTGAEVIELGPCNATIHKVDERVRLEELEQLRRVYLRLLENLSAQNARNG